MGPSYNDSFGQGDSGVSGTGVISSGDAGGVAPATPGNSRGDIILSSSNSGGGNGGKRRWLVVIVVLLFLVAIGVGVAMMAGGSGGGSGNKQYDGSSLQRYANYIINGDETDDQIGEGYVTNRVYHLADEVYNAEDSDFQVFYEKVEGFIKEIAGSSDDIEIIDSLNEQGVLLKLFKVYRQFEEYDEEAIVDLCLSSSCEALKGDLETAFGNEDASKSEFVKEYKTNMSNYIGFAQQLVNIYWEAGCSATNADELSECDLPAYYLVNYTDIYGEMLSSFDMTQDVIEQAIMYYLRNIYALMRVERTEGEDIEE